MLNSIIDLSESERKQTRRGGGGQSEEGEGTRTRRNGDSRWRKKHPKTGRAEGGGAGVVLLFHFTFITEAVEY